MGESQIKKVKKVFSFLLVLAMMFNISASSYAYAAEEANREDLIAMDQQEQMLADLEARGVVITHVTDNTLVSNIKNTKNGVLTFTVKIPAGQTLYYTVKLVPNDRTGSIDTAVDTSFKNTSSSTVTKQITANVKYYSNLYTISASYTTGNSREQTVYECEKQASSELKSTVYSEKFVWTQSRINAYRAGQSISVVLVMGTTIAASLIITPMITTVTTKAVAINVGWEVLGASGTIASIWNNTTNIEDDLEPKLNMSYQTKFVPTSQGISRYLTINKSDGTVKNYTLSTVYYSGITPII